MVNSKENIEEIYRQQNPDLDPPSPQIEHDAPQILDPSHGLEDEIREAMKEELDMELLKSARSSKS